ncbi:MAG: hypothetical protein RLZ19_378 [Actinomycetota bacterium]
MNTPDNSEMIDDWASRLIDGDIVLDDVSAEARDAVTMRAEQFRVVRETLLRSRDDAPTSNRAVVDLVMADVRPRRRLAVYITGVAAAAAVASIIGVAVSSSGDSREPSTVAENATQTKIAADEPAPATEAPAAGQAPTAMDFSVGDACPDDLRPTIIPIATIGGEDVEIHWSAAHGVVVYRISDCSIVLATTP